MKLDIGCGNGGASPRPGYTGVDRQAGGEAYPLKLNDGSPVADCSVDELVASHVLEHFPHGQVHAVLAEWVRVLKPGGLLKVAVPDLEWIAKKYLDGENHPIQGYLMGGQSDENDYHRAIFDNELLSELFRSLGLVDICPWKSGVADCAALPVSLNLCAKKPKPLPPMKVVGAMSVPRLCFSDNFLSWAQALMPFGISPTVYGGAFWGQCLERVMTDQANSDAEWILTVDYDSVFTREHVRRLLELAAEHPEADAIAPIQMSRGRDNAKPLLVMRDKSGAIETKVCASRFEQPLIQVQTAHFGLTMIRVSALQKLTHPWFKGTPAPDGQWGEGRIDDDIHFWLEWEKAGNTLFVANRVVIGHAELMITWPDKELDPIRQYPSEFHAKGTPEGIWE